MGLLPSAGMSALALLVGLTGGSYYTAKYKEADLRSMQLRAAQKAAEQEDALKQNIVDISKGYNDKIAELDGVIADANSELGRLRVRRCPTVPKAAGPSQGVDDKTSDLSQRDGEVEVDLDRAAAEIIRLGGDLDKATQQIIGLQATIDNYLRVVNKKD